MYKIKEEDGSYVQGHRHLVRWLSGESVFVTVLDEEGGTLLGKTLVTDNSIGSIVAEIESVDLSFVEVLGKSTTFRIVLDSDQDTVNDSTDNDFANEWWDLWFTVSDRIDFARLG